MPQGRVEDGEDWRKLVSKRSEVHLQLTKDRSLILMGIRLRLIQRVHIFALAHVCYIQNVKSSFPKPNLQI